MDCSTPGLPILHRLLEFAQTHVHGVGENTPILKRAGGAAVQTLPELPGCSAGTAGQASPPRRAARVAAMGQDV